MILLYSDKNRRPVVPRHRWVDQPHGYKLIQRRSENLGKWIDTLKRGFVQPDVERQKRRIKKTNNKWNKKFKWGFITGKYDVLSETGMTKVLNVFVSYPYFQHLLFHR